MELDSRSEYVSERMNRRSGPTDCPKGLTNTGFVFS